MKEKRLIIIFGVIILIIAASMAYFLASNFLQNPKNKGSVSRNSIKVRCDGKEILCIQENGTIEQKEAKELAPICKENECGRIYAANTRAAIKAIRLYTGVESLNLKSFVKNSTPSYITYYCNDDDKCWAVDHKTHAVVNIEN